MCSSSKERTFLNLLKEALRSSLQESQHLTIHHLTPSGLECKMKKVKKSHFVNCNIAKVHYTFPVHELTIFLEKAFITVIIPKLSHNIIELID